MLDSTGRPLSTGSDFQGGPSDLGAWTRRSGYSSWWAQKLDECGGFEPVQTPNRQPYQRWGQMATLVDTGRCFDDGFAVEWLSEIQG